MPRVMFTISYTVKPSRRDEYLSAVKELQTHYVESEKKQYMVFEGKGKKNQFTEVFLVGGLEEFEALDENQDERVEGLINRIEEMIDKGGRKYSTLLEVP